MSKYKVGDVIYYDELKLNGRVRQLRYHACVIQRIDYGNELFGKWYKFSYIPTKREMRTKECGKPWGWMYGSEVLLLEPTNKNKRLE